MQRAQTFRVVAVDANTQNFGSGFSKHRHSATHWISRFPVRVRLCIFGVVLICIVTTCLNFYRLQCNQLKQDTDRSEVERRIENELLVDEPLPKLVVVTEEKLDRLLAQPLAVLRRLGYEQSFLSEDPQWDILWTHGYPFFGYMSKLLTNLQPYQKVNHFPGTQSFANKIELATSNISRIPLAFRLPRDANKLHDYAKKNPKSMFVQKSNAHRGIRVMKLNEMDLKNSTTFVQKFIDNPLLVDGRMFDVGVYVILTSVDPLRVYVYEGEAVIRLCTKKYHPFDAADVEKYVIGTKYMSPWDIEALQEYYVDMGLSMRDTLDAYIKSVGKQPQKIWKKIEESIREVFYKGEANILAATKKFKSKKSFFELYRADFLVDENLEVYLLEVNFSPNLALGHLTINRQRYEQLLFNLFSLVNVGRKVHKNAFELPSVEEEEMQVCDKNLVVFTDNCVGDRCRKNCSSLECQLCKKCWTASTREMLRDAYLEHGNRLDCKRLIPPTMDDVETEDPVKKIGRHGLSTVNQLMHRWFEGKCRLNRMWCS